MVVVEEGNQCVTYIDGDKVRTIIAALGEEIIQGSHILSPRSHKNA